MIVKISYQPINNERKKKLKQTKKNLKIATKKHNKH
jgi:hypothetical protein